MRGRSPCVRWRSQLWQQRRHMLVLMNDKTLSRRAVVAGLPLLLAGCSGGYRSITGELYSVPFVSMHPDLMRQEVAYGAPYRTGTVVVNIRERRLYLVQAGGRALRYAVGVGRAEARNFHGSAVIGRKEPWPSCRGRGRCIGEASRVTAAEKTDMGSLWRYPIRRQAPQQQIHQIKQGLRSRSTSKG